MTLFIILRDATGIQFLPPHQPQEISPAWRISAVSKRTCVSAGCLFQACGIDVFSWKLAENAQEGLQAYYLQTLQKSTKKKNIRRLVGNLRRLVGTLRRFQHDTYWTDMKRRFLKHRPQRVSNLAFDRCVLLAWSPNFSTAQSSSKP